MVITGAADRASDRVGKLVYLDAANPADGQSLADLAGPMITSQQEYGKVVDGTELVMLPETYDLMWQLRDYFGIDDPAERAWLKERLTPQPWKTFAQPLRLQNEQALAAIPQFHVVCEQNYQYNKDSELFAQASAAGRLWRIDTGHDLMITEPEAVTAALMEIAASS